MLDETQLPNAESRGEGHNVARAYDGREGEGAGGRSAADARVEAGEQSAPDSASPPNPSTERSDVCARLLAHVARNKASAAGLNAVDDSNRRERDRMRASGEKPCPVEGREACVAGICPDESNTFQPDVVSKNTLADRVKSAARRIVLRVKARALPRAVPWELSKGALGFVRIGKHPVILVLDERRALAMTHGTATKLRDQLSVLLESPIACGACQEERVQRHRSGEAKTSGDDTTPNPNVVRPRQGCRSDVGHEPARGPEEAGAFHRRESPVHTVGPAIQWTENADAGDSSAHCTNCGEERDDEHSWRECAEYLSSRISVDYSNGWRDALKVDGHSAVQSLVRAMWLYRGYRVDARGPVGCLIEAIRQLEPETAQKIEAGEAGDDWGLIYEREADDSTSSSNPSEPK